MPKRLLKLNDAIDELKDAAVKNALKSASKYLTDLSIRNIVDYIITLERESGGDNG